MDYHDLNVTSLDESSPNGQIKTAIFRLVNDYNSTRYVGMYGYGYAFVIHV